MFAEDLYDYPEPGRTPSVKGASLVSSQPLGTMRESAEYYDAEHRPMMVNPDGALDD